MKVKVRLFAVAKELAGSELIDVDVPLDCTVSDLRCVMFERFPKLKQFGPQLRFAVNAQFADNNTQVHDDSDVACIPPVSGG
jgi:molybdopterin converting factor small subunit